MHTNEFRSCLSLSVQEEKKVQKEHHKPRLPVPTTPAPESNIAHDKSPTNTKRENPNVTGNRFPHKKKPVRGYIDNSENSSHPML
jgi:hypothetical protein